MDPEPFQVDLAWPSAGRVRDVVLPLAARFQSEGYRLYLVGGVVRDLALAAERDVEAQSVDIDMTTDARPAEIKALIEPLASELWAQGERFGTIGAVVNGHAIEVTTHRAEVYDPESRKPIVTFGDHLEEDLSRRDFTINAAALEVSSGELHDPFRGLDDLSARVLRTPLSAETSFSDDPLRMLRAARFIPRFGLTPDPTLFEAARSLSDRLNIVSVERIADELNRLLAVDESASGWEFLREVGVFAHAVPGFSHRFEPEDRSQWMAIASALASEPGSVVARRAGLLWPLGSAQAGLELDRLKVSRADRSNTVAVLEGVERALGFTQPIEARQVRALAADCGFERLGDIATVLTNLGRVEQSLGQPWPAGGPPPPSVGSLGTALVEAIAMVGQSEDLRHLVSPLGGAEIMRILDVEPGPVIGAASEHLRQLRIEQGPISSDQAREHLIAWWEQRR